MIYTCQSRMFLCIGEAPSMMIVAHVSCSIVPCIAATHEIALCMHIHTDNTDAHCAAPGLPAATIQTGMLYREGLSGDRFSLSASVATRTSAKRRIILE